MRFVASSFTVLSPFTSICSFSWNIPYIVLVIVVGFDIIASLIEREKRERPQQGRTLDRRIAVWKREVEQARWQKPTDVKAVYGTAGVVGNSRTVFDIRGNNYRLVVQFNYAAGVARVRFAGTHAEYDRIDVTRV